jgi:hypothetical protein
MALIAIVDGVRLYMYANDHPPPHFHALFAEHHAVINIRMLRPSSAEMQRAKLRAVLKWAEPRRALLLDAWETTQALLLPERIR